MPCAICRGVGHNARTCVQRVTQLACLKNMLTNESVLERYANHKKAKQQEALRTLREKHPKYADWADGEILAAHDTHVSIHQSKDGKFLEKLVETALREANIAFQAQVPIDANGYIVEHRGRRTGLTIPDIVIGTPIVGTHIRDYIVLSLKTSSRERAKQDEWTRKHAPSCFYYATLTNDYPDPDVFGVSETRKLVSASPKDERVLRFDDLIARLS